MELPGKCQDRADVAIKETKLSLEKAKTGFRGKKTALRPKLFVGAEWATWRSLGDDHYPSNPPTVIVRAVFEEGDGEASTENAMRLT